MEINLQELNYKDKIDVNKNVSYSSDYLKDTEIIRLDNVEVNGALTTDIEFNCLVSFSSSFIIIPQHSSYFIQVWPHLLLL